MPKEGIVVTGVARHSLGEAFVHTYRHLMPRAQVIGIDRIANHDLDGVANFRQLVFDLNPLKRPGGLKEFAAAFAEELADVTTTAGLGGFKCLVQCAGVYDFGKFLDHDVSRRENVLGVNVLGTTEVLYAVMALNVRLGLQNAKSFINVLVASFQGLYARADRPVYAPSKAYGVDLCTTMFEGKEVAKCICVVPAHIDTAMLHRNHWVTKAGGSEDLFNKILSGPRERYRSIFTDCNERALVTAAREKSIAERAKLTATITQYKAARLRAYSEGTGILSAEACANALADIVVSEKSESGVYVLTPTRDVTRAAVRRVPSSSLDRRPGAPRLKARASSRA